MSQSLLGEGIAASIAATIPKRSLSVLGGGQALLCAAAFAFSPNAGFAALVMSLIAFFRYLMLASFAATIGTRRNLAMLLSGSLWLLSFLGLGIALVLVAHYAHDALFWAAASACLGPLLLTALALFAGGRAMSQGQRMAGGLR